MKKALPIGLLVVFVFSMFSAIAWGAPGMSGDPVNGTTDEEGLPNSPTPPPPPPPPEEEIGYGYNDVRERAHDGTMNEWDVVFCWPVYVSAWALWELVTTGGRAIWWF